MFENLVAFQACRGSAVVTALEFSGLYYKTITIVIMTIVSDATIWSVTYDRN